jgi:hypothetical protein
MVQRILVSPVVLCITVPSPLSVKSEVGVVGAATATGIPASSTNAPS